MKEALLFILVVANSAAYGQGYTAQEFLNDCRGTGGGTICVSYVMGYVEGTILAEAKAGKPSRYCLPNGGYTAVFLEITLAYTNFLSGEERKNNVAILSKPTAIVLDDFLDSRYRCKTKW
jgi:hypothetical protein